MHPTAGVIYQSQVADVDPPRVGLAEHILAGCARYGDRPALVDAETGETITFNELSALSSHAARGLRATLGPGDVVALISHNQPRYAVALYAALRAGCTVAPMNPLLTVDELTDQMVGCGVRAVIASTSAADKILQAARRVGIPGPPVHVLGEHPGCSPFDELLADAGGNVTLDLPIDPETVAALLHSSGTTDQAKAVMLTHNNLVANLEQLRPVYQITSTDVLCAAVPLSHVYGMTLILNAGLLAGATIVTLPRFQLHAFLKAIEQYSVTRGHFAPPIVAQLATDPQVADFDLSSLRAAMSGAAPLDEELARQAEKRIGCRIRQGYGMTEAGPGTHIVFDDEFEDTPLGSVGRLMPGTRARIVDPVTGRDADPAHGGELWIDGPQVMRGYLGDPAKTAETLVDGWLRTGDLVRVDALGRFWVVDRLKDVIKYKGYQVPPAELEALLRTHPAVADAAVCPLPDPVGGELPQAFVVVRHNVAADIDDSLADDLMDWVARRVAPYKRIRALEFVTRIPRTPSGKVLRRELNRRIAS